MHARVCARLCLCAFACLFLGLPVCGRGSQSVCVCVCLCAVQVFACVCLRLRRTSFMRCVFFVQIGHVLRPTFLECECAGSAVCVCGHRSVRPIGNCIWERIDTHLTLNKLARCNWKPVSAPRVSCNAAATGDTEDDLVISFVMCRTTPRALFCAMPHKQASADATRQCLRLIKQCYSGNWTQDLSHPERESYN